VRILVTGADGFVGRHLMPTLAAQFPQAELIGCGRTSGAERVDITDPAALQALVARVQPTGCVHLAAVAAVSDARADPACAWAVNLHGTLALGRAILLHAPQCRLVFASTADLYGASFRAGVALDETALPAPLNTYAATKAAAELGLGVMAAEGLRVVRVRPFNHTGPGQRPNFAVPAFARQIMRIQAGLQPPVLHVGDLSPWRDFLDVRDVCAAYAACLRPEIAIAPGTILNIASGQPRRIGDVLQMLIQQAGVTAEVVTDSALLRRSDIPMAVGNARAARDLLGWRPRIDWSTTISDVIADWRIRVTEETATEEYAQEET
jgi:nucleoside-diphosphate-sugar epimerase